MDQKYSHIEIKTEIRTPEGRFSDKAAAEACDFIRQHPELRVELCYGGDKTTNLGMHSGTTIKDIADWSQRRTEAILRERFDRETPPSGRPFPVINRR